jgi:hypothetical protein
MAPLLCIKVSAAKSEKYGVRENKNSIMSGVDRDAEKKRLSRS